jgi:hypothetical protein
MSGGDIIGIIAIIVTIVWTTLLIRGGGSDLS